MHFGEVLSEEKYLGIITHAYESGIRTFVTSDVYGVGKADELLGKALQDVPRDSYCLVGMLGHDFYNGERQGSSGYPRFTHPDLRGEDDYKSYLTMACEKSLSRCQVGKFDLVMLHNPDEAGYLSEAVWEAMRSLKDQGLAERLGIGPGPANGFTLDLIDCFRRYGEIIDWAMIILNPLEPWPGQKVLPAAQQHGIDILTRVVDYGGIFHGQMRPGHEFKPGDHRAYRPEGWVERGYAQWQLMEDFAKRKQLTPLQFASVWNLSQAPVKSVVPTFIQEAGEEARPIEEQIMDLASLPEGARFSAEEVEQIRAIGDNTGCMKLKGASQRHDGPCERPDEWPMREELLAVADDYGIGRDW